MSWTLIEHQALTSSVASVTLGSGGTIPQTYKTLKIVVSGRQSGSGADSMGLRINASTSNNSSRWLTGSGSAASSGTDSSTFLVVSYAGLPGTSYTSSTFGSIEITIPNYAGATNKPISADSSAENNATEAHNSLLAALWSSTTAVTSLYLAPYSGGNFVSGSTFTLYGLA